MINLNLVIDGNFLMMKNISSLWKEKLLYSEFYNVLEKDYNKAIHLFNFKKIFFVSDSTSNWRKEFYPELKSTRKKDNDIDWKFIYQEFKELKTQISTNKKVEQLQVDQMEGDDIIGYSVKKLNAKGESTFIVASDSDLYELITYDGLDLKYINMMYNFKFSDERVYLPEQYSMFIDNINRTYKNDIFSSGNEMEFIEFFQRFITGKKVVEINNEFELFKKIMGHGKDDIKSIFIQNNRGIGETGIKTVYTLYKETFPQTIDFNSEQFQTNLIDIIKFNKKLDDTHDSEIKNNLIRNLKITKLDEISTPRNLYENMKNLINI